MRWRSVRLGLAGILALVGLSSFLYSLQGAGEFQRDLAPSAYQGQIQTGAKATKEVSLGRSQGQISAIPCVINGKVLETGQCLQDEDEIYVPFRSLVQPYFEINGFIESSDDGPERFIWWHNSSRISKPPSEEYKVSGPFGPFGSYNVEGRERVKCINGLTGVPMSTQWGKTPYYYPIQIAQFALQHYSKNLDAGEVEEFDLLETEWNLPSASASVRREGDSLLISSDDSPSVSGATLEVPAEARLGVLSLDVVLDPRASLSLHLFRTDTQKDLTIHYLQTEDGCVGKPIRDGVYVHSLGKIATRRQIVRNMPIDLGKVIAAAEGKKKSKGGRSRIAPEVVELRKVEIRGRVQIYSLKVAESAHRTHFLQGADWFLQNQGDGGGWSVPVRRSLAGERLVLGPGWHSAMGQGHGMSLLARAYLLTKDEKYLKAAEAATALFSRDAASGGVSNRFLDSVVWFEEYPTTPGSFVLNGFLYSLLGLWDLGAVSESSAAAALYSGGLESLCRLLPLFDSGGGSFYDLRHFSLPGLPPNRARSDYHTLHIYQLLWLAKLEPGKPLLRETAQRWVQYALGKTAKHN